MQMTFKFSGNLLKKVVINFLFSLALSAPLLFLWCLTRAFKTNFKHTQQKRVNIGSLLDIGIFSSIFYVLITKKFNLIKFQKMSCVRMHFKILLLNFYHFNLIGK